jgi:NAD(P)-dependent dehydrogenase (short-subunit alcohol dehydrogenase family)
MTVVLITGALTGIGRATALAFAREGDRIVVSGRHGEAGEDLTKELRAQGAEAEFICADVRFDEEMRNLVDQTVNEGQDAPRDDVKANESHATAEDERQGVSVQRKSSRESRPKEAAARAT